MSYTARLIAVYSTAAEGGVSDEAWRWTFTTGEENATEPPALVLEDVVGRFRRKGGNVNIYPNVRYEPPNTDNGPIMFELLHEGQIVIAAAFGVEDLNLPEEETQGQKPLYGTWGNFAQLMLVEPSMPDEMCVNAHFVNAAGAQGPDDTQCGPLERIPSCSTVSLRSTGALLMFVVLVLGLRRRRSGDHTAQ